ncbi:Uncharacterised protein [Mycobacterium tuberculosis]|uniref:Uncharacterized protein n=1 Tax=Mycobacterium tuberculosis TaxID=1773 RepID=A0A655FUF8_MYCTX|nr:Uncharacterised protein [Mycobacterium tuberculosis]
MRVLLHKTNVEVPPQRDRGNTDDVVHTLRQREPRSAGRPGENLRVRRDDPADDDYSQRSVNKKRHHARSLAVANSFVNVDRTKIDDSLRSWSGPRRRRAANALARHCARPPWCDFWPRASRLPQPSRLRRTPGCRCVLSIATSDPSTICCLPTTTPDCTGFARRWMLDRPTNRSSIPCKRLSSRFLMTLTQ